MKELEFNERNASIFARLHLEMVDRSAYSDIIDDVNYFYRERLREMNKRFPMTDKQFENLIEDVKYELESSFRHHFRTNTTFPELLIEAMNFDAWVNEIWEKIYETDGNYRLPKTSTFIVETPLQRQVIYLRTLLRTPSDPRALGGNGSSGLAPSALH